MNEPSVRYARCVDWDVVSTSAEKATSKTWWSTTRTREDNVMAIFCGATGKLLQVVVLE